MRSMAALTEVGLWPARKRWILGVESWIEDEDEDGREEKPSSGLPERRSWTMPL